MKSNAKPSINSEIFLDYVQTVFLPYLAELRPLDEFAEEMEVLLMDNCPSHITSDVITLLIETRARLITFPPHTTQIFQVLEVTLFGVLKQRARYELPLEVKPATVKFMMKVYHDFKQTMANLIYRELSSHSDLSLSLIRQLSHIDFYSTRNN
jgi:hypothetical protein